MKTSPDDPINPCMITEKLDPKIGKALGHLHYDKSVNGLTKREWFAGLAMQGFCSTPNLDTKDDEDRYYPATKGDLIAKYSVYLANALIAELNKENDDKGDGDGRDQ